MNETTQEGRVLQTLFMWGGDVVVGRSGDSKLWAPQVALWRLTVSSPACGSGRALEIHIPSINIKVIYLQVHLAGTPHPLAPGSKWHVHEEKWQKRNEPSPIL